MAETVVFVQGGNRNEQAFPWQFFHLAPYAEPATGPVELVFFDYPAGTVKTWKNHTLIRGKPPTAKPDTEEDLQPKVKIRLELGGIDEPGPERPSVLALYDWVKKQRKGSIRSLQVFSHGTIGGPVIWNSYQYDPDGNRLPLKGDEPRDPHDTDFRVRDFHGSNPLAGAEGKMFAEAFTPDALVKLWGCFAPSLARTILLKAIGAPKGAKGDAGKKDLTLAYLGLVELGFAMQMAVNLNLSVWAAPLGYGTYPWPKIPTNRGTFTGKYRGTFPPDLSKQHWWRVSWFFRNQDNAATYYRDVLKARIDPMDYVEHRKSWLEQASQDALTALDEQPSPVDTPADLQRRLTDRVDALGVG